MFEIVLFERGCLASLVKEVVFIPGLVFLLGFPILPELTFRRFLSYPTTKFLPIEFEPHPILTRFRVF